MNSHTRTKNKQTIRIQMCEFRFLFLFFFFESLKHQILKLKKGTMKWFFWVNKIEKLFLEFGSFIPWWSRRVVIGRWYSSCGCCVMVCRLLGGGRYAADCCTGNGWDWRFDRKLVLLLLATTSVAAWVRQWTTATASAATTVSSYTTTVVIWCGTAQMIMTYSINYSINNFSYWVNIDYKKIHRVSFRETWEGSRSSSDRWNEIDGAAVTESNWMFKMLFNNLGFLELISIPGQGGTTFERLSEGNRCRPDWSCHGVRSWLWGRAKMGAGDDGGDGESHSKQFCPTETIENKKQFVQL